MWVEGLKEYTEENVIEAGKLMLEKAGVPKSSVEAMLHVSKMPLDQFLKFAAYEHFVWGDVEPRAGAVFMVRKALRQYCREGEFNFAPVPQLTLDECMEKYFDEGGHYKGENAPTESVPATLDEVNG